MRHALKIMLTIMALLTAFHGFKAFLGAETYAEFSTFMLGDYPLVWERHSDRIGSLLWEKATSEEFRLYVIAGAVLAAIPILLNFITVSRNVCAAIAGVFLFNLAFWYFATGEQPSTRFSLIGIGSLLWMIASSFIRTEEGGIGRLYRRIRRRLTS